MNDVEIEVKEKMLTSWFVTYGLIYNPAKFKRVTNGRKTGLNKPDGGLWSSPMKSVFGWKDWCEAEGYRQRYGFSCGFRFRLKSKSKIFIIDSFQSYKDLLLEYGMENLFGELNINWETLSKDYDGVFLTYCGFLQTRDIMCDRNRRGFGLGTYSWDCESLIIFDLNVLSVVKSLSRCEL